MDPQLHQIIEYLVGTARTMTENYGDLLDPKILQALDQTIQGGPVVLERGNDETGQAFLGALKQIMDSMGPVSLLYMAEHLHANLSPSIASEVRAYGAALRVALTNHDQAKADFLSLKIGELIQMEAQGKVRPSQYDE